MLTNMKISTRLIAAFAVVILFLVAISATSYIKGGSSYVIF